MVARLCAVAFIAFASLLVVGNGTVRAADDYSNSQSDDSYSTPDTEQQPAAPDYCSAAPPQDDRPAAPDDSGGDAGAPPPPGYQRSAISLPVARSRAGDTIRSATL